MQQFPLRLTINNCYKSTINYGKQKIEKLWKIEFDSKTVCDDDDDDGDDDDDDNDKYIKTKNKNIWL